MAGSIRLRNVRRQDWDMLLEWLQTDYIRKWFGSPQDWMKEIHDYSSEYSWISHFVACFRGVPIGYCRYFECGKTETGCPWEGQPEGSYGIDYLIGRRELLGRGLGNDIVAEITRRVITDCCPVLIIAAALQENVPSVRALLANGYSYDEASGLYILRR